MLLKDRDAQIKRLEAELAIEDRVPEASPNTTTSFFDEQEIYQQVLRDCQYENASAALARPQRDRVSSRTNQFSDGFVFNPEPNSEGHIRSFSANSKVSHIPRQSKKINGIVRIPGTDVVQKMNDNISGPFPRKENNSQASIVSARSDISFRAGSADSGMSEQQPTLQKQSGIF